MDIATYDKAKKYKPGRGYELRNAAPTSIVVHSTSNPRVRNTPFAKEATFLLNAALVSAHYLIGKDGVTVRFLDPRKWAAWHAGNARSQYVNQRSIGVELHHSVGDPPYPQAQLDALAVLLQSLWKLFVIPIEHIETHGQIALPGPYDRKTDPSDMTYQAFLEFRARLGASVVIGPYRAVTCAPVFQDRRPDAPLALTVTAGTIEAIDDLTAGWVHLQSGAGFSPLSCWEAL